MSLRGQTRNVGRTTADGTTSRRSALAGSADTVWAPSAGSYLTDGTALFCVADAFSSRGELFLELENCATLGLVLCPARTLAKLELRPITPAHV